jgi:multidrug efflux pump
MVIGVFPLLIAGGAGAKSRFDIGIVIAAGMTIGTMFTLFITPAIYSYVARDRRKPTAEAAVPALAVVASNDEVPPRRRTSDSRAEAGNNQAAS